VDIDVIEHLLIIYSAFVRYWNVVGELVIYRFKDGLGFNEEKRTVQYCH